MEATGSLRLVDFDGSWIAPFEGKQQPPNEQGHPNYQPRNREWGEWMDTFPGLLVYVSLLALSRNTQPWRDLYDEDNLLFQRADFTPPYQTRAWNQIAGIGDAQVDRMLRVLRQTCAESWKAQSRLEDLLQTSGPGITDWVWELERKRREPGQAAPTSETVTQRGDTGTPHRQVPADGVWWPQSPAGTTQQRPAGWDGWNAGGTAPAAQRGSSPNPPPVPSHTPTPPPRAGQGRPTSPPPAPPAPNPQTKLPNSLAETIFLAVLAAVLAGVVAAGIVMSGSHSSSKGSSAFVAALIFAAIAGLLTFLIRRGRS